MTGWLFSRTRWGPPILSFYHFPTISQKSFIQTRCSPYEPDRTLSRTSVSRRSRAVAASLPMLKSPVSGSAALAAALSIVLTALFLPNRLTAQVPDSGLDFFSLQPVFQVPDSNLSTERSREIQAMWSYPENIKERFDELVFTGRNYSNAYFRRAISMFDRTRRADRRFLEEQKEVYRLLKENDDPRPFSAKEGRDRIRNDFAYKKIRHHETMAAEYKQVLNLLDSGKAGPLSAEGRSELYLETLRLTIVHYSKGRRYHEAMWHLRRYYQLDSEAIQQWPFHYYVAVSLYNLHQRSVARSEPLPEQRKLHSLRDRYTLNYLELRYGRDSYQYTETFARLRREAGPLHFLKDASDGL